MTRFQMYALTALRVTLGWLFFYAGITKVINPDWSAAGYLTNAKSFAGFYDFLASPSVLPIVNFLNAWGLTLIGAALMLGIAVRLAGVLGAVMMLLYYFALDFPYPNTHSLVVDEHIIYAAALLLLAALRAGRTMGLENWCANLPICKKYPVVHKFLVG